MAWRLTSSTGNTYSSLADACASATEKAVVTALTWTIDQVGTSGGTATLGIDFLASSVTIDVTPGLRHGGAQAAFVTPGNYGTIDGLFLIQRDNVTVQNVAVLGRLRVQQPLAADITWTNINFRYIIVPENLTPSAAGVEVKLAPSGASRTLTVTVNLERVCGTIETDYIMEFSCFNNAALQNCHITANLKNCTGNVFAHAQNGFFGLLTTNVVVVNAANVVDVNEDLEAFLTHQTDTATATINGDHCCYPASGNAPNGTNLNPVVSVADDEFTDPDGFDFTLKSIALCRNAGKNTGSTPDIAGVTVPKESVYDIGAYEYNPPVASVRGYSASRRR